ncbi:hypothetical protein M404DRAFT_845796 [Pisolithus tinctorius Marx 270]|uniref:Uncharacterized protein n=1 Tax=Pisolithus tinctorius Marx 270 TaxID=870435 RepID=A0A0C3NT47_PISTI|nr:hypothetical protein M404DRAFT_845796 [Pisolithus tinctorius Marx 270]
MHSSDFEGTIVFRRIFGLLRGDYVRLPLLGFTRQCIHHYFTTPNTACDRLASEIIAFSTSPLLTHLALCGIPQCGLHCQEREWSSPTRPPGHMRRVFLLSRSG